jgi:serine/threonine-protein kinase
MPNLFQRYPRFWRGLAWVAGLFTAGFLISNFILMPVLVRRGAEVEVPDVRGMPYQKAFETLAGAGLEITPAGWQYDPGTPDSTISSQEPEPRMMVKKGRKVKVVLSRGAEKIPVPYLVGLSAIKAINLLDRIGLTVGGIDSLASDSVAVGCVVSSNPAAGAPVEKGKSVVLILSKGPTEGRMAMPDLVGRKLAEIQGLLVSQGLVVGQIKYMTGDNLEPGTIMMQTPQAGFVIKRGDTINLGVNGN